MSWDNRNQDEGRERLQTLINEKKITQAIIANFLNCSREQVRCFIIGTRNLSKEKYDKVLEILGRFEGLQTAEEEIDEKIRKMKEENALKRARDEAIMNEHFKRAFSDKKV